MFDDVSTLQTYLSSRYKTPRQTKVSAKAMLSNMFNQSILGYARPQLGHTRKSLSLLAHSQRVITGVFPNTFEFRTAQLAFNYLPSQYNAQTLTKARAKAKVLTARPRLTHKF